MTQRRAVLQSQVKAWPKATKKEKSAILDHLCAVNGWHRDHARKMMRRAVAGDLPTKPRPAREPVYTYGPEVIEALVVCWAVLDGPAGKVLRPALPDLVPMLLAEGELSDDPAVIDALLAISAATIDRRLAPYRTGLVGPLKGRSMTRPGSMLKSQIPIKTWHEWDDTHPGFLEIDLVAHDGGDNNGEYHWSMNATDVATGWTEAITVRSKGERIVGAGLDELVLRFPFAILGIHSDNGSEFINHHLLNWTQHRQITFTRGRPNHHNDQAHIEQKNWTSWYAAAPATTATTHPANSNCSTSCGPSKPTCSTWSNPNSNYSPRPAKEPEPPRPTTPPQHPGSGSPATTPTSSTQSNNANYRPPGTTFDQPNYAVR